MKLNVVKLGRNHFDEIKVPNRFQKHPPKPELVISKMVRFIIERNLGDVLVDENMEMIDGYCSYLIAKQLGTEYIKIKQVRLKNNE